MIKGRWFITPHAVRRYIERVDRRASYDGALAALAEFSHVAHRVRRLAPDVWLWRGPRPLRLRFCVSEAGPGAPQLITVLRGCDR